MALPDYFRVQTGTLKTFKSSGGDAAITLNGVLTNAARQSAKLDLGATRAEWYDVFVDVEFATAPTAGQTVDLYWAPSSSSTAGTDNPANVSGTDAAYTGYSSNLSASLPQLQYIGSLVCTSQATTTVQKGWAGRFSPAQRYGSLVFVNSTSVSLHTDTNIQIRFAPLEGVVEE